MAQPLVTIYHPKLKKETRVPRSTAERLKASGWEERKSDTKQGS